MPANVILGDDDDVLGKAKAPHPPINLVFRVGGLRAVAKDYEDVKITVRAHVTACRRTEENNAQRMNGIDDATDEFVEQLGTWTFNRVQKFPRLTNDSRLPAVVPTQFGALPPGHSDAGSLAALFVLWGPAATISFDWMAVSAAKMLAK